MLQFNHKGFLIPANIISSTLEEFESEFVLKMKTGNRQTMFDNYKTFCADLKKLLGAEKLTQWVDGSYVTQKPNPSDIDLVTFIDADLVRKYETELKDFIFPKSKEIYGVDAYLIAVHPENEKTKHFLTQADRSYWIDHFDKTTPTKRSKGNPKGFLEIII